MTIRTMRYIDRFVGIPMCWVVGVCLPLFERNNRSRDIQNIRSVLVVKFFGMGSILLSTPALSMLKSALPNVQITFLSFRENYDLLKRIPHVDDVLVIDPSSLKTFVRDTFSVIVHLLRTKYDVVFDFEFFSKFSTLLNGLTSARVRIGFALPTVWRSNIVTHPVPLQKKRHVVYSFISQVSTIVKTQSAPSLISPIVLETDVQSMLAKVPLNGHPVIAINVNAGSTFLERRWSPERFAELISRLALETDFEFMFTGTNEEQEYVRQVIERTSCPQRCFNLAGLLSIPELAALLQRCELLISNDSGPLHLAAALRVRCIGLYGPESPDFYGPLGESSHVIYKRIECSPCMNIYDAKSFQCPYSARCMKEISVAEVEAAVKEIYIEA